MGKSQEGVRFNPVSLPKSSCREFKTSTVFSFFPSLAWRLVRLILSGREKGQKSLRQPKVSVPTSFSSREVVARKCSSVVSKQSKSQERSSMLRGPSLTEVSCAEYGALHFSVVHNPSALAAPAIHHLMQRNMY